MTSQVERFERRARVVFAGSSLTEVEEMHEEALVDADAGTERLDRFLRSPGQSPVSFHESGTSYVARYELSTWGRSATVVVRWNRSGLVLTRS